MRQRRARAGEVGHDVACGGGVSLSPIPVIGSIARHSTVGLFNARPMEPRIEQYRC